MKHKSSSPLEEQQQLQHLELKKRRGKEKQLVAYINTKQNNVMRRKN